MTPSRLDALSGLYSVLEGFVLLFPVRGGRLSETLKALKTVP